MHRWLDMAPFLLGALVLGSLMLGWFLPATYDVVFMFAMMQIVLAIVVVIREGLRLFSGKPRTH